MPFKFNYLKVDGEPDQNQHWRTDNGRADKEALVAKRIHKDS